MLATLKKIVCARPSRSPDRQVTSSLLDPLAQVFPIQMSTLCPSLPETLSLYASYPSIPLVEHLF